MSIQTIEYIKDMESTYTVISEKVKKGIILSSIEKLFLMVYDRTLSVKATS